MANSFYNHANYPTKGSLGSSSALRAELESIEAGFNKLPTLVAGSAKQVLALSADGAFILTASGFTYDSVTGVAISAPLNVSGVTAFTGTVSGLTPTAAGHFTTKGYIDTLFGSTQSAALSATSAANSAASASTSATSAANSATSAAGSATSASTSATSAANSAINANASATLSVASSTAAGISASNALNSSVTAQQSLATMQGLTNSAQASASSANLSAVTAQNFAIQAQDTAIAISTQYTVFTSYRDAVEGIASLMYDQVFLVLKDERRNGKASFYQYQQADNPSLVLSFPDGPFQAGLIEDTFVFLRYQNPYARPFIYSNFAAVDITQLEDGDFVQVDFDENFANRKTRYKFFGADYVTLSLNFDTGTYANGVATNALVFDTYVDPQVVTVPATSTSTGRLGEFAVDAGFLYVAVSPNTWKRIALTAF